MDVEPSLTNTERERIRVHAQRTAAYAGLLVLYRRWVAEIEIEDRVSRATSRILGGIVAAAAALGIAYELFSLFELLLVSSEPPIVVARFSMWHLAALSLLFLFFSIGLIYALWQIPKRWAKAATRSMPVALGLAIVFFFLGLMVLPLIVWSITS